MKPSAPVTPLGYCRPAPARSRLGRLVERIAAPFVLPALMFGAIAAFMASRLAAVGVVVNTGVRPGSSNADRRPGSTYFVVGITERGDTTTPVLIRSMAEYEEKFGARVTYGYLHDDLTCFFAEGGERAYVTRVVGASATLGLLNLLDTLGVATVRLTAKNAGAWTTGLTATVEAGAIANTFTITLTMSGTVVEVYIGLTTPADAVTQINARSNYVVASNLASASAAPANNPAVLAATALSAGTDDRASVVAGDYTTALARFAPTLGSGIVAIPGQVSSAVGAGLAAHCVAYRRVGAVTTAAAQSIAQAKTAATALRSDTGGQTLGLFYPWVLMPDGAGGTRTVPPSGYVAGVRARAFRDAGPWRAPAGEIGAARFLVGTERAELTAAEVNDLTNYRVNPIRTIAGSLRLYGWRSLSVDEVNYKLLTARDTLNVVAQRAETALEQFVYRPVDGRGLLFSGIEAELVAILDPYRAAGGLYELLDDEGSRVDPGYVVDTSAAVNTPEVLANNEVRANVALRISPAAELITITVTKVAFDAALA